MSTKVTIGSKAYSFTDQALGISIVKGEVAELSAKQMTSKKIVVALNGGHLRIVQDGETVKKYNPADVEALDAKLLKLLASGKKVTKVAKDFTLEEAKLIAAKHEIQVEDSDTVETIFEAIAEDTEDPKGE